MGTNCGLKPTCVGANCPCTGTNCGQPQPCVGANCPCTGTNCGQKPCEGDDCPCEGDNCGQKPDGIHIRFATANVTSGDVESYDPAASQNILRALDADIVMLQEFKVFKQPYESFVSSVFGPDYEYFRGTLPEGSHLTLENNSAKPNGIISRYPFVRDADGNPLTGEWRAKYEKKKSSGEVYEVDASYDDRQWTWAVVDIPGDRDLLVVSVHLSTEYHAQEFNPLAKRIAEKQAEGNYYVVIGGDFNTKPSNKDGTRGRTSVLENESLMSVFYARDDEWPVDQNGNANTNLKRESPLDWLLFSHALEEFEIPTEIGDHDDEGAYEHGHVFDTRVYDKTGELEAIQPEDNSYVVSGTDSGNAKMQHMAVIRDIEIPVAP